MLIQQVNLSHLPVPPCFENIYLTKFLKKVRYRENGRDKTVSTVAVTVFPVFTW
jgi:hypothetical protein